MFPNRFLVVTIDAPAVTGALRRLGAVLAALAVLATACSSGGGTVGPKTKTSVPPALGRPNPLGAKWDWTRLDAFKPYLASLSGGATFYDVAWCDVERTE
ncbi:MAG: hypothetical protein JO176_14730, partial [Acidimicrobiia bacterium]|nr:hypothetical protein [Acidimicrobiia bacterium]